MLLSTSLKIYIFFEIKRTNYRVFALSTAPSLITASLIIMITGSKENLKFLKDAVLTLLQSIILQHASLTYVSCAIRISDVWLIALPLVIQNEKLPKAYLYNMHSIIPSVPACFSFHFVPRNVDWPCTKLRVAASPGGLRPFSQITNSFTTDDNDDDSSSANR